ncbi:MAG TPA: protein kinase [Candidatus Eisenbacteria bacterium]
MIGTRIAHYEIVAPLGAGGMGEVFLARDARLEREVAVKLLPARFSRDPESLARFRREALTLAALNHPNIATIHGFEEAPGGALALVLEYVPGESLAHRLERGALSWTESLSVCAQVAEALEVAHERGVVHRDLKPGNVMLAPRGLVKVLDFGLAGRAGGLIGIRGPHGQGAGPAPPPPAPTAPAAEPDTLGDVVAGTPGYMSPEQVLAGEQDERTDVFAFGCVLYECLTGRRAFGGDDPYTVMAKVLYDAPDAAAIPEAVPRGVRDLLARCLEKDAAARLRDMRAIRHEIEEALGVRRAAALRAGERAATPHNLPRPATSFVGREEVMGRIRKALAGTRLLTLLGMGGSGKTRLALRLAEGALDDHPDGVWFADLAALDDPERVVEAVADAVGARAEPGTPLEQTLLRRLKSWKALLVMDNCESVLSACQRLAAQVLAASAELRIVATSREPLAIAGETTFAVPPLALPAEGADAAAEGSEAVQLFAARAAQVAPDFALGPKTTPVVAEICRRLDGIPLALELAAARVRVLGPEKILARLGDRFRLLTASGAGGDGRHQTLRAVIEWSANQLVEDEPRMFRALSAFAGTWSLESATTVCGAGSDEFEVLDVLQRLADKSLVVLQRDPAGDARYRYLESVRHFAGEQLAAAGEADGVRGEHLSWFLAVAEGSQGPLGGPEQKAWLVRLDLEHDDLLAAHRWAAGRAADVEKALRLAGSLARYWSMRGHFRLARRTLHESLEKGGEVAAPAVVANALARAAGFALYEGDYVAARPLLERSLESSRRAGDEKGVARALSGISTAATYQRDYAAARARGEEALALYRMRGDRHASAIALHNLGYIALETGALEDARRSFEEAAGLLEGAGDERHLSMTRGSLGLTCLRLGDSAAARRHLASALALSLGLDAEREAAYALEGAAELAEAGGEPERAARWMGCAAAVRERIGSPRLQAEKEEQEVIAGRIRKALGAERAQLLRAEGAATGLDPMAREALDWLGAEASGDGPRLSQPSPPG